MPGEPYIPGGIRIGIPLLLADVNNSILNIKRVGVLKIAMGWVRGARRPSTAGYEVIPLDVESRAVD